MNEFVKLQLSNTHTVLWDLKLQIKDCTIDQLFESAKGQMLVDMYFSDFAENGVTDFSKDDFISELKKLFVLSPPTKAIAESFELESWLDSSKRIIKEDRFNLYKKYLIRQGKGNSIEQLESETFKILDSCHNPNIQNRLWDRRGLVYGNVQSGKTANFIGLINRAFDHGYQIVIVLTGVTEDLRRQTQLRVNSGVLGISSGEDKGIAVFDEFQNLKKIKASTSINFDLSTTADWRNHNITLSEKSIWVIKKNPKILEALIFWLHEQRLGLGNDKIFNVPFLIIDDEADNASIQSMSKKDFRLWELGQEIAEYDHENLTPEQEVKVNLAKEKLLKSINRNIRIILSLIGNKTFIGYTATPYSIINQKIEDIESEVFIKDVSFKIDENTELFPEHFIIPIKPGSSYIGIEKMFNSISGKRLPILINISKKPFSVDLEKYFPSKRGVEYTFNTLPQSLIEAIYSFIVVIIIRKFRNHDDFNTMLIHTSHLTRNADYLYSKVNEFISNIISNIYSNDSSEIVHINRILQEFKLNSSNKLFTEYFGNQDYRFPEVISKEDILNVFDTSNEVPFQIVSYHSSESSENSTMNRNLSFDAKHQNGDKKLSNYIVIGGNRLSRGLTLEGLSVSYFVRSSTRQDSLYQMARWFGYRLGYEDLIKVFMPRDQILWFDSVYKLEENLRRDFEENISEDSKILPRDAIIKMAYHTPENLFLDSKLLKKFPSICDPNKLRNTLTQELSFFGTTKSKKIIDDSEIQRLNVLGVKEFMIKVADSDAKLFDNRNIPKSISNHNINFTGVDHKYIIEFLRKQRNHEQLQDDVTALIEFINKNSEELDDWSVVLAQKPSNFRDMGDLKWEMEFYDRNNHLNENFIGGLVRTPSDSQEKTLIFSKFLDSDIDNTFDIIDSNNIEEYESTINQNKSNKRFSIRNERKKPILIIYLVAGKHYCFPLFYITIPHIVGGHKVRYIIRNK